ncbi:vWA domain-containing protein [Synoicihabitans lomoniglobus]|uniref:VWA domain-containing protein n=1 Tax=Synoicihabitans lomoniglobus TaxID=2909285 RepID=A0AAF0CNX7_9BACT|nr:VWA domain-containing protein [Opitutaceae bacterium LMO-M01]WED65226.1 VWA domain-containing protein [Opitutaceae bacterium LMO-M01]
MRRKRRSAPIFSVSFLDCICCGFGGVLLLFVLLAGKQRNLQEQQMAKIREVVGQYEFNVKTKEESIQTLEMQAKEREGRSEELELSNNVTMEELTEMEQQLALLMRSESELQKELELLLAEKEALATTEIPDPVPIPNVKRRQYLTGFQMEGQYILFLVRASGSMVGNTIEEAIELQSKSDEEKRASKKWKRVVDSVRWLISSLPQDSAFQVMMFAEETEPLLATHSIDWIARDDGETIREVIKALEAVVPKGGANLERAFLEVRGMSSVPDSLILLTDGLPTQSDSYASGEFVSDEDRVRFFNAAARVAAGDIPVNTILYPLEGDPASPFLFWQLADKTKGALVSPAPSWPDIR